MDHYAAHKALVKDILRAVGRRPDLMIWQNQTGVARSMDGQRVIRFGLNGSPDLMGVLLTTITPGMVGETIGRALGIEAKTGRGEPSEDQRNFHGAFARRGGLYMVARSAEDVLRTLP